MQNVDKEDQEAVEFNCFLCIQSLSGQSRHVTWAVHAGSIVRCTFPAQCYSHILYHCASSDSIICTIICRPIVCRPTGHDILGRCVSESKLHVMYTLCLPWSEMQVVGGGVAEMGGTIKAILRVQHYGLPADIHWRSTWGGACTVQLFRVG